MESSTTMMVMRRRVNPSTLYLSKKDTCRTKKIPFRSTANNCHIFIFHVHGHLSARLQLTIMTTESCSKASGITDAAEIIVQLCKDINLSDETVDEQRVRSSAARDLVHQMLVDTPEMKENLKLQINELEIKAETLTVLKEVEVKLKLHITELEKDMVERKKRLKSDIEDAKKLKVIQEDHVDTSNKENMNNISISSDLPVVLGIQVEKVKKKVRGRRLEKI